MLMRWQRVDAMNVRDDGSGGGGGGGGIGYDDSGRESMSATTEAKGEEERNDAAAWKE